MLLYIVDCYLEMILAHPTLIYLPQFVDPADNIGGQWTRFNEDKGGDTFKPTCPAKSISIKVLLVCFVVLVALYREMVLSAVSKFYHGATVDSYSTLFCNIDTENELQCLVHMQPQSPETRHCYTTHETVNHSFCGVLHPCCG